MSLTKQYFKYVSQNIFGLLGTSCYILADTYFISQAAGTSGVALLNLCLPIYNFIFAIGSMLGLGAATRYAILRAQGDERSERYFSNALLWALVFALPFMLAGIFCPEVLLRFMGGDAEIVALGVGYARIFLLFTPLCHDPSHRPHPHLAQQTAPRRHHHLQRHVGPGHRAQRGQPGPGFSGF